MVNDFCIAFGVNGKCVVEILVGIEGNLMQKLVSYYFDVRGVRERISPSSRLNAELRFYERPNHILMNKLNELIRRRECVDEFESIPESDDSSALPLSRFIPKHRCLPPVTPREIASTNSLHQNRTDLIRHTNESQMNTGDRRQHHYKGKVRRRVAWILVVPWHSRRRVYYWIR
jgi:hypothetical protein